MKKIYLAIASIFVLGASFGQYTYDAEMVLTTPVAGSTVPKNAAQPINFTIKNNGPDATAVNDTLYVYYFNQTQNEVYALDGTAGSVNYFLVPFAVPSGGAVTSAQLSVTTLNTTATGFNDGDVIYVVSELVSATNGTDAVPANDAQSFTLGNGGAGVDNASIVTFSVYPNPAKDVLNIFCEEGVKSVSVLSLDGKLISTTNGKKVDVSGLNAGIYLYSVTTSTGNTVVNKFIKE